MSAVSPYTMPTLEEAYEYWVERILPMHKGAGRITRKPSFATWCGKMGHKAKFEEFNANGSARTAAATRGKGRNDLLQQIAEALASAGIEIPGVEIEAEDDEDAPEYAERRDAPADAARNGVLWVLNTQGLLAEAIERAEGDYITQDEGTELLTETFGPLDR